MHLQFLRLPFIAIIRTSRVLMRNTVPPRQQDAMCIAAILKTKYHGWRWWMRKLWPCCRYSSQFRGTSYSGKKVGVRRNYGLDDVCAQKRPMVPGGGDGNAGIDAGLRRSAVRIWPERLNRRIEALNNWGASRRKTPDELSARRRQPGSVRLAGWWREGTYIVISIDKAMHGPRRMEEQ